MATDNTPRPQDQYSGDPCRRLIAAVVLRAVNDLISQPKLLPGEHPHQFEDALTFLTDDGGPELLAAILQRPAPLSPAELARRIDYTRGNPPGPRYNALSLSRPPTQ